MNKEEQWQKEKCELIKTIQARDKSIQDLEKENAELKEKLKEHESIGNAQFWENVWSWKTKADQLTKAKEIIKAFLDSSDLNIKHKAEEFLGEF